MTITQVEKIIAKFLGVVFLQAISVSAFAQRVSCEDIYGDCSGGGGGIFGWIGLLLFVGFIVWGFVTNKGFRLGVLAYAGFLGGMLLIFKEFGKDAGIAACVVAIIILWFMDPANRDKE